MEINICENPQKYDAHSLPFLNGCLTFLFSVIKITKNASRHNEKKKKKNYNYVHSIGN